MKNKAYQKNIKNLAGTFRVEHMALNDTILLHLNKIEKGTASYQQIVEELKAKHTTAGR